MSQQRVRGAGRWGGTGRGRGAGPQAERARGQEDAEGDKEAHRMIAAFGKD